MHNESAKIILAATHGKLTKVRDALAIEDTINALKVEFQFRTTDWDNTIKTASFVRGYATPSTPDDEVILVVLDKNNECDVPHEVLENSGIFSVGVWGVNEEFRITSNWMYYKVADGCFAQGSASLKPTQTVYEQILNVLANKSDSDHNHDDRYLQAADLPKIPVQSVNEKIGDVVLTAEDVGAFANTVNDGVQVSTVPYSAIIDPPLILTQDDVKTYVDSAKKEINTTIDNLDTTIAQRIGALEDDLADMYYTKYEVDDSLMNYYTKKDIEDMFNITNGTGTLDAGKIIERS